MGSQCDCVNVCLVIADTVIRAHSGAAGTQLEARVRDCIIAFSGDL